MSITRGEFLRSLGKSLPGVLASTGMATAAETLFRRLAQAAPPVPAPAASRPAAQAVPFLTRGPEETTAVALTFDDGPVPGVTERILDTLRAHEARATFFMIGEKLAAAPGLARRVIAEGHEVGHHTYTHRKLTALPDAEVDAELDRTHSLFKEILDFSPKWFRPPYGELRQDQAERVQNRSLRVVLWSLDSEDWRPGATNGEMTHRVLTHLQPGAIVLLHEVLATAEGLDAMLNQFRATTPFRLVTLSEMTRVPVVNV